MPSKRKPSAALIPVESLKHADKRRNIPTEELRDFDRRQTAIQQRAKLTPCSKEE